MKHMGTWDRNIGSYTVLYRIIMIESAPRVSDLTVCCCGSCDVHVKHMGTWDRNIGSYTVLYRIIVIESAARVSDLTVCCCGSCSCETHGNLGQEYRVLYCVI